MSDTARPNACPPDDAKAVDRTFLRFVRGDLKNGEVVGPDAWQLPYENPKSPCYGKHDDCFHHAHSLVGDPADIDFARKAVPFFRRQQVAEVAIRPNMGVVRNTPSSRVGRSHHSWWPEPPHLVPDARVMS